MYGKVQTLECVVSWFCTVQRVGNQAHMGEKVLGQKNPAHVWQQFCPPPVGYRCQTVLAVISAEWIFSQTLWEVVCKGDVNKNYCRKKLRRWRHVSVFSTLFCTPRSCATWFGILTCGDLQIPVFLHKHRRHPEAELWPLTSPTDFRQSTSAGSLYTRCSFPTLCIDLCHTAAPVTQKITNTGSGFTFWPMNYHLLIFPKQGGFVRRSNITYVFLTDSFRRLMICFVLGRQLFCHLG